MGSCPVKAIRVREGLAEVVMECCIGHVNCYTVRSQGAKEWKAISGWLEYLWTKPSAIRKGQSLIAGWTEVLTFTVFQEVYNEGSS